MQKDRRKERLCQNTPCRQKDTIESSAATNSNRHRRRNLTSRRHAELILLPLSTRDSALPADGKKIAEEEVPLQGQNQSTEKKQGLGEKTAARYQGERESSAKAS